MRKRRRRQRGRTYGPDVNDALWVIDDALDHITEERQTPNLEQIAESLATHGGLRLSPRLCEQLGRSASLPYDGF